MAETNARRPEASAEEIKALLDAANQASSQVAVLHIAFMAVCAYVLIVVFGTKDIDLLVGKGVKLPVIDTEVPIVGFYALAPYLVLLIHFNLLLQLQLLSRKLYAFDAVVPSTAHVGGVRDRLHIFPYTYYLVGRARAPIQALLSGVVAITILLLPLATLMTLQLRFLAYQDSMITWAQRVSIWIFLGMVLCLWPIIMNREDSWPAYMSAIAGAVRRRKVRSIGWIVAWLCLLVVLFTDHKAVFWSGFGVAVAIAALIALGRWLPLRAWRRAPKVDARPDTPASAMRGVAVLLLVAAIGLPAPAALFSLGETLAPVLNDRTYLTNLLLSTRRLELTGEVLLKRSGAPELLASLRDGGPEALKKALDQMEGLKLARRSLRNAQLDGAFLSGADLSGSNLMHAKLDRAHLEGANLYGSTFDGAELIEARLEGVSTRSPELGWSASDGPHKTSFRNAVLMNVHMEGATLTDVDFTGANLQFAKLQGALIARARLAGANLSAANLQGATLVSVDLQAANLSGATLYTAFLNDLFGERMAVFGPSRSDLIDLRGAIWQKPTADELNALQLIMAATIRDIAHRKSMLKQLSAAGSSGVDAVRFDSCLMGDDAAEGIAALSWFGAIAESVQARRRKQDASVETPGPTFTCQRNWLPAQIEEYRKALHPVLADIVCRSGYPPYLLEVDTLLGRDVPRLAGFAPRLSALLDEKTCPRLRQLPESDKKRIRGFGEPFAAAIGR